MACSKMLNGKPFYTTHVITDFALQFLSEEDIDSDSNPFFLYIAYNAPHYPLHAPKKDVEKYNGAYDAGWDVIRKLRYQNQLKSGLIPEKFKLLLVHLIFPHGLTSKKPRRIGKRKRMEVFAAMIDIIDQNIGRLLTDLKSRGVLG